MQPTLTKIVLWFVICSAVVLVAGAVNLGLGLIAMCIMVPFYRAMLYG